MQDDWAYSLRKANIGSTFDALYAGKKLDASATRITSRKSAITVRVDCSSTNWV
ncbi:MAG: hypothetical protein M3Y72_18995 [Acidobacteriota bacterium]|nr:hypothetical protein [Acidobacteriota bacterium]